MKCGVFLFTTLFIFGSTSLNTYSNLAGKFHCVILPGFGNDAKDYINPPLQDPNAEGFVSELEMRGISARVVPIKRTDWLKVLKAVTKKTFWTYSLTPSEGYGFYLNELDRTVREACIENDGKKCILIGHSAGGWLARAKMGDNCWHQSSGSSRDILLSSDLIEALCTLGTPHVPPTDKERDATRGSWTQTQEQFPGAHLSPFGVKYLSVAGTAVRASGDAEKGSIERYAVGAYKEVLGEIILDTLGDGVVPLSSAHLPDPATRVTLPGVYHSINAPNGMWYGGAEVIDQWLPTLEALVSTSRPRRPWFASLAGGT
jgi:hypothetical protein